MQSVTIDHFCSNYRTCKTQPTVTPDNQWAQGSSLAMSLVYSFFNDRAPQPLCPEQGELPHRGSLLLTRLQRYTFLPHLSPFFFKSTTNIFRNLFCFYIILQIWTLPKCSRSPAHMFMWRETNISFHTSAVTLSSFQYMSKNSSASMQEHYGPCQTSQ